MCMECMNGDNWALIRVNSLTHGSVNKIISIWENAFWNALFWRKKCMLIKIRWSLFLLSVAPFTNMV